MRPSEGKIRYIVEGSSCSPSPGSFALAAPYLDLPPQLSVAESLALGTGLALNSEQMSAVLSEIGLLQAAKSRLSQLSSGMRQRVLLAMAFYKPVEVILLDEPLNHLDSQYQSWCQARIQACAKTGQLIIACSQNPNESSSFGQIFTL